MNQFLGKALSHLFGSVNIDAVSAEEFEKLTNDYPYFPVAQMLLSKKLQSQSDAGFLAQVQKTALYFSNPYWLHYQLLNEFSPAAEMQPGKVHQPKDTTTQVEQQAETLLPAATPKTSGDDVAALEEMSKVVLSDGDDNVSVEELIHGPSTLLDEPVEQVTEANKQVVASSTSLTVTETPGVQGGQAEIEQDDQPTEPTAKAVGALDDLPITTEFTLEELETSDKLAHETLAEPMPEDVPITTVFSLEELIASDELAHETLAPVDSEMAGEAKFILPEEETEEDLEAIHNVPITTKFTLEELVASDDLAHETLTPVESENEAAPRFVLPEPADIVLPPKNEETGSLPADKHFAINAVETFDATLETINIDETNSIATRDEPTETPAPTQGPTITAGHEPELPHVSAESFSNNEMLKNIKSILDSPLPHNKQTRNEPLVPIDPYHTVDYFASQGIKLVLEKDPKDKLGRQLKSFTQWLKHMKKLGPEDAIEEEKENAAEATIIKIADFSNTRREIITEAMAEVLEKQGKAEKAVQVYIKLSFLHPDKSAYFADKIKNLKGIR